MSSICLVEEFMTQIQGHWDFKLGTLVTAQDKQMQNEHDKFDLFQAETYQPRDSYCYMKL